MTTMADLDELALAMPQTTKEVSVDGRPAYLVDGKLFCCHRTRRPDAIDSQTGERLDDVLMFRVAGLEEKELLLSDDRGVYFTTPHFNGYPAVLVRIPALGRIDRDELRDLVVEAWLTRAQKRVAKAFRVYAHLHRIMSVELQMEFAGFCHALHFCQHFPGCRSQEHALRRPPGGARLAEVAQRGN